MSAIHIFSPLEGHSFLAFSGSLVVQNKYACASWELTETGSDVFEYDLLLARTRACAI